MANIYDENKDLKNSANVFDDDLFGNSSNDIFGNSDDLFNTSTNDLFSSNNSNKEENIKDNSIQQDEKKNNQSVDESLETLTEDIGLEKQDDELEGYYDDNGYYWFNNGTYYDNNGLYHDLDGNVIDENGNIVETNTSTENPAQITEEEKDTIEQESQKTNLEEADKGEKKKQKNKKEKKKISLKIKLIICGIVLLLFLGGGTFLGISYYKKISVKLETPILKIEKLYNKVVLEATEIENAVGYEFVVSIDDEKPITLKSSINKKELEISNYKKLEVKVRCLGKVSKAHSNYSAEQTLSNKIKLNMSTTYIDGLDEIKEGEQVISYKTDADISDDIISWESVKNASKYYVYYKVDIDKDEVKKYEVDQAEGTITFNLLKMYQENGAGSYSISVVAIPENDEYYEMSDYSDMKTVEYYTKQDKITSAELNKDNNLLTIYTDILFKASKISLSFNYGIMMGVVEHQLITEDLIKEEVIHNGKSALKFTINISEFVKNEVESISIIVLGDGKYSTNSDSYILQ